MKRAPLPFGFNTRTIEKGDKNLDEAKRGSLRARPARLSALVRIALALLTIIPACARAPSKNASAAEEIASIAPALWTRDLSGVFGVGDGIAIAVPRSFGKRDGETEVEALDAHTGQRIWFRKDVVPVSFSGGRVIVRAGAVLESIDAHSGAMQWRTTPLNGSTTARMLLVSDQSILISTGYFVESIEIHTGALRWQTKALCGHHRLARSPSGGIHVNAGLPAPRTPAPTSSAPTFAAALDDTLYVGCSGGQLLALRSSDGKLLASAHPIDVDGYDRFVVLGTHAVGVAGPASDVFSFRESAIVTSRTLTTIASLGKDRLTLGSRNGAAIVADTCCLSRHSDTWPANIETVSLATGRTTSVVALHPYRSALPPDKDLPGAGVMLLSRNTLYVGTHSALFAYDLGQLHAQPRMVLGNLIDLPQIVGDRYLFVVVRVNGARQKVALLDSDARMREVWDGDTIPWIPVPERASLRNHVLSLQSWAGGKRVVKVIDLHSWKMIEIDGGCNVTNSDDHYVAASCVSQSGQTSVQMYELDATSR